MSADPHAGTYDLHAVRLLAFHEARRRFLDGDDTPRDYLERCILE